MTSKLVRKVCFLSPERDALLLEWLAAQKNESAFIRAALWAYFNQAGASAAEAVPATVDPALIRQAVAEALDLTALRQVVEAAIRSSLPGQGSVLPASPEEDEAELDAALDDLNNNLVLG